VPDDHASSELPRRLAPFGGATLLAFALVAVDHGVAWTEYAAAVATALGVLALIVGPPWSRIPEALRILPGLLFVVAVFLLRDSVGGANGGVGVLVLLPACWLALHGTRAQIAAMLVAVAAFWAAPVALIGGPAYPISQLRAGAVFVVVAAMIGLTVHGLVGALRSHAAGLARVAEAARSISAGPGAREQICAAACEVAGCAFALLFEPAGDGGMRLTSSAGLPAPPVTIPPGRDASATHLAFVTRKPVFVDDAARHPAINRRLWEAHGRPVSMLFEPVLRGDEAVGVLVVAWRRRVRDARAGAPSMIALLAAEAASAIAHADLIDRLAELAATDPLTGLPNRRTWDSELDRMLARARPGRLCVAMLDLDHFKAFNDARGHLAGDRLLKEAAALWRDQLRPGDLLARYGGEEFVVLLPECDLDGARAVIERLRAATPTGQTCSAGVAAWGGSETAHALTARADAALYEAKRAGRDRLAAS
jgi:diguanylate cyclase (GGDEF)-like protein